MGSQRLMKIGEVAETPEGKRALVNQRGTGYLVQDSVIIVWDAFDGKTADEVAESLASMAGKGPDELREPVREIATGLRAAGLLIPAEIER